MRTIELAATGRQRIILWIILFASALLLRGGVAAWRPPQLDGDQRLYLQLAESLSTNSGYVVDGEPEVTVHPLLPTLHATALLLMRNAHLVGIALTILIGSLLPVVAGKTCAMLYGFGAGYAAGWVIAVQPYLVLRSIFLEPDILAALLFFWLAALLLRGAYGMAGSVLGLAFLNRPESYFLLPVSLLILWTRGVEWRKLARFTLLFLAISSVFILYLRVETGRWALSGKDNWQYMLGVHQWQSHDQPLDVVRLGELQAEIDSAIAHMASDPGGFLRGYLYRWSLLLRNIWRHFGIVLLPFFLFGVRQAWKIARRDSLLLILPLFLLPVLPLGATFFRHSLITGSIIAAFSGVGCAWLLGKLGILRVIDSVPEQAP